MPPLAGGTLIGSTSAATLTPALPAGVTAGQYLLAFCQLPAVGGITISVSSGWTIRATSNSAGASVCWADRVATGSDSAPVFTWAGAAVCHAQVLRYTGQSGLGAIAKNQGASGTTLTPTSITTTADNSLVLELWFSGGSAAITPPWVSNSAFSDGCSSNATSACFQKRFND